MKNTNTKTSMEGRLKKEKFQLDEIFLQPWFVPKPIYLKIRKLLPSSQMIKLRYYFDDYGCLRCEAKGQLYGANGMCTKCSIIIRGRIAASLARRFRKVGTKVLPKPLREFSKMRSVK